jgi:hypothetical protein
LWDRVKSNDDQPVPNWHFVASKFEFHRPEAVPSLVCSSPLDRRAGPLCTESRLAQKGFDRKAFLLNFGSRPALTAPKWFTTRPRPEESSVTFSHGAFHRQDWSASLDFFAVGRE